MKSLANLDLVCASKLRTREGNIRPEVERIIKKHPPRALSHFKMELLK